MSIKEIVLPDIGEGVKEGEMVQWLVKVGDNIEVDQPIAEMMTDKATVEVPSPFSGQVKELKVQVGDIVPIHSTLLLMEHKEMGISKKSQGGEATHSTLLAEEAETADKGKEKKRVAPPPPSVAESGEVASSRIFASPATRKLAREMNVDLSRVKGTGLAGRVLRKDIISQFGDSFPTSSSVNGSITKSNASHLPVLKEEQEERVPFRGIRRKIALQMKKAKSIVPHFTIVEEAFVSKLVALKRDVQQAERFRGVKLTYLPFVIKSLTQTLREFPIFNACLEEEREEIIYKKYYHIGVAVSTEKGLMVPNIKNADQKTVLQIASDIKNISKNARRGQLTLSDMQQGTFTVTNIGSVGGTSAAPVINYPEVAILGMYKIRDQLVCLDELPSGRSSYKISELSFSSEKVMNFSITCDHRLIDGAVAAEFLKSFISRLENPNVLLLEMI